MDTAFKKIEKYLLECGEFTIQEYNEVCELYGYNSVANYFNRVCDNIDKDELDSFLEKFHVFFEEEVKIINKNAKKYLADSRLPGTLQLYINDIMSTKLLSFSEEKEVFNNLNIYRSQLKIMNIIDSSELKIDYATLFMSVRDERQIKSLTDLYKANYKDDSIYEKTLSSEDVKIVKHYFELYKEKGEILSYQELIANFPNIDFDKYTILSNREFVIQIDTLIKFLNTVKKIEYSNVRLVISIAKRSNSRELEMNDLVQEGNIGLRKALLKFDNSKTYKFSTYATWWIMQAVGRAVMDKGSIIRKPVHVVEKYKKYKKTIDTLMANLGRNPTPEEISSASNIPLDDCLELEKIYVEPTSLDELYYNDSDSSFMEYIADNTKISIEEEYEKKELADIIERVLEGLNEREANILRFRFGLGNNKKMTLEELGIMYGVTRERIRQIQNSAFKKIKKSSCKKYLKGYVKEL